MFNKLLGTLVTASLLFGNAPMTALVVSGSSQEQPAELVEETGTTDTSASTSETDTTSQPTVTESSDSVTSSSESISSETETTSASSLEDSSETSEPSETSEGSTTTDTATTSTTESSDMTTNESEEPKSERVLELEKTKAAEVEVSKWDEFKAALTNESVTSVKVMADLSADSAGPTVKRAVAVDFAGHTLDIKSRYLTITDPGQVTLNNLKFTGASGGNLAEGTGTLIFTGTITSLDGNQAGIINANAGTVIFDGVDMTYDRASRTTAAITTKNVTVKNGSQIVSNAIKFYLNDNSASDGAQIIIEGNSYVETNSNKDSNSGQVWEMKRTSDFWVKGHSTLIMNGNISDTGDDGGLFIINGEKTTLNVLEGSHLESHSKNSPAVLLQSKGGSFNVDNESTLKLQSDGQGNTLGATLRFRLQGDMTFNINNQSKIEIEKTAKNAPAIRMYGNNNKINVSNGSDFIVKNKGDGTPRDPGADGRNQGIQYTAGSGSQFNLTGEDSSVEIIAENGAAIDAGNNDMQINAAEGTYFTTRGQTGGAARGIFNAGKLDFVMNKVKYFDFRNNRPGGGYIMESSNAASFSSTGSDVSFWEKGSDLDGDPLHQWYQLDFALEGTNFTKLTSTTNTEMQSEFGSLTNYSRMSANNQSAHLDELRVPTNADKFIYAHASIPEAKGEIRDAFTGEVMVKIGLYDETGKEVAILEGESIGESLAVYNDEGREGLFKIDAPNKEFLKTGYTLKVLEAWRGNNGSAWIHQSKPEEITPDKPKVYDVTPADPVKITGDKDTIAPSEQELSGTGEVGDSVTLTLNGTATGATTTVDAKGDFTIALPSGMKKDDVIQVFLRDHAGLAEVVKPPVTNDAEGNIEPAEAMHYHDADFAAATKLQVVGSLTLESVPDLVDFGTQKIMNKTQTYYPKVSGQLVVSDTRGSEKAPWQLTLKEEIGLHSATNDLSGLMSYKNKNGDVVTIGKEAQVVESRELAEDGSETISQDWGEEHGLSLTVPVGKQLLGEYKGTLSWTLQDVPGNE